MACLLGIRFVHGKSMACVFTDGGPFRWRLGFESAFVWAVVWFAAALCSGGSEPSVRRAHELPYAQWFPFTVAIVCTTAVQATTEEVFMRGYLQTRMGAWTRRPWLAITIVMVVFTVLHRCVDWAEALSIGLFGLVVGVRSGLTR